MKFKVGDKVKFVGIVPKKFVGRMGIVDEVRPPEREFPYSVRFDVNHYFPVFAWEIEKFAVKGQQLLFEFMI